MCVLCVLFLLLEQSGEAVWVYGIILAVDQHVPDFQPSTACVSAAPAALISLSGLKKFLSSFHNLPLPLSLLVALDGVSNKLTAG